MIGEIILKEALIVIDMQNDFITGSLGTAEAKKIVSGVAAYIKAFNGDVYITKDTHGEDYLHTPEGQKLPVPHCILGTKGHELCDELLALRVVRDAPVFLKRTFGSKELAETLVRENPERIVLIGLCTDICIVSNALLIKAFLPESQIIVESSLCAGVTPEKHCAALEIMKSCQIEVH